jgi:predicted acetyltransferase
MTQGGPDRPEVRPLGLEDAPAVFDVDQWAFGFDTEGRDRQPEIDLLDWSRVRGAHLDGELRGIYAVLSQDLPVPGGSVPTAGVTWVGVHPAARRRGVLTAMVRDHLEGQLAAAREPVSTLFAAEVPIYGRFGYGMATRQLSLTVPRGAALRPAVATEPAPRLEFDRADKGKHAGLVAQVWERARQGRPGWVSRPDTALADAVFHWPKVDRRGAEEQRILIARDGSGTTTGYAVFARRFGWVDTGPAGVVVVRELAAVDPATARALWGVLLDLDLTVNVEVGHRAPDDPLLHLLADVRAAAPRLSDGLWVRLVDLPVALAARRYQTPIDVVLEVTDALLPANAGRWRLRGGPDSAVCEPATGNADLVLDVRDLGAAYLGGESLLAMASAGLVREERAGAVAAASAAFSWPVAPWCPWVF